MKHRVRIDGCVQEMDFELGSGICDKDGVEIFEGDLITSRNHRFKGEKVPRVYVVEYDEESASFIYRDPTLEKDPIITDPLECFRGKIEIVGHREGNRDG